MVERVLLACSLLLAGVSLIACGGDSGGDTGRVAFSTGIDPSRRLSALSPSEIDRLCTASQRFVSDDQALTRDYCKLMGISLTTFVPVDQMTDVGVRLACQTGQATCLAAIAGGKPITIDGHVFMPNTHACMPLPAGCMATIAELEACWSATPAYIAAVAAAVPVCADITVQTVIPVGPNDPPACVRLTDRGCGNLSPVWPYL